MLITKMPKILIVGSGLTGSLVASSLRHHLKENVKTPLELSIWDKARGTGSYTLLSTLNCNSFYLLMSLISRRSHVDQSKPT